MDKEELLSYVLRQIEDEANSNVNSLYFGIYPKEAKALLEYIKGLEKQVEQEDHYKHLYSEVKKQKDDVVKVLKALKYRILYEEDFRIDDYIDDDFIDVLLRMLGETECK